MTEDDSNHLKEIKELLQSLERRNSNFTNQLLRANNEISQEIEIRLNWIFGILIGILGALYFMNN